jgi:dimethylargininase
VRAGAARRRFQSKGFDLFRHAIVRALGDNFAEGLSNAGLGKPNVPMALLQYEAYCRALEGCGLEPIRLPADLQHPDSTFVEDTAVLTSRSAILARPGAASRQGEVANIRGMIERFYSSIHGSHFFIGISRRTNEDGARQLSHWLAADGFTSCMVDIRGVGSILHLKSGIAYLDNHNLVVMEELADREEFSAYKLIRVAPEESYACNCVLVNDRVLMPAGFPLLQQDLARRGYQPLPLEMSEFRKMDGGLSCLSLRF